MRENTGDQLTERGPHVEVVQPSRSRHRWGLTITIVAALLVAGATLGPSSQQVSSPGLCVFCGDLGGVDFILNVALFTPLGFGLALAGVRVSRAIPLMIAATIGIELMQVFLVPGRDASVGDVVANTVGGTVGWFLGTHSATLVWPRPLTARRLLFAWLAAWLLLQATASYAVRPEPSIGPYYGRIGRANGGRPPYAGRVLGVTLDGGSVPDMSLPRTGAAVEALRRGSNFGAQMLVVPGPPVPWVSQIVRIVDSLDREVLLGGARWSDLVVSARSGAATLRLRPMYFRLPDAFAAIREGAALSRDTVLVEATLAQREVSLVASAPNRRHATVIHRTASGGWRHIAPRQTYLDGSMADKALNAAWLMVLMFPTGYWAAFAGARSRRTIVMIVALGVALGLSIGPVAFHLRIEALSESLGALAGVAVGVFAAHAVRRNSREDDTFQPASTSRASLSHTNIA